jgi:pimeloyl-ACP methyl ester carboxylesterase
MNIRPFTIQIEERILEDLKQRLSSTRWPDELPNPNWEYGANLGYMKQLIDYWHSTFDWRKQEEILNRFRHFKTEIDDMDIHFIHERGKGAKPLPLIITHGWPGSFAEMLKIIPLLTDPKKFGGDPSDSFDVVVPSMPGFGFSDRPTKPGVNVFRISEMWVRMMNGLGYERFCAQGGDFGAGVSTAMGLHHPKYLFGIHLNYIPGSYRPYLSSVDEQNLSAEERQFLASADEWYHLEGGYSHIQRTKPQTVAYALNDSPAGLAAWIVEKFRGWGDCHGDVESRFTRDELLTNVTIYWLTQTISSSVRLYYEGRKAPMHFQKGQSVTVPCAVAFFPKEEPFPPRRWIERGYNVQHWTNMPRGGHFAALEEPELLAEDIRRFCRQFR